MSEERGNLDALLSAARAAGSEPERRAVNLTLLVVDVAGSAGYFDRQGKRPEAGVLEQYERMGTRAVDGYGGRVVRILGDTLLAEFSEPLLAVQAAVHLQRRLEQMSATLPSEDQVKLRMGVAQGPCFRAGGDLTGEGVERAAGVCRRAGPAQILITQEMREAVAGYRDIQCTWLGKFRVGERDELLFEVVWTEANQYAEIRHNTTTALRRGDLLVPGLQMVELADPDPAPAAPVEPPYSGEEVGQRTGEFVPMVPASLKERYDIRGELGRGGMGVVYKAFDRETEEMVALKVLRGEIATDDRALVRFRNEVRVARRITHRNVCRIHDFNRAPDAAYISMEFIEGRSLRTMITESGAGLPLEKGIEVARQICAGLAEAHRQGVIHRDLKPENVMVDGEGTVRLLDFGIARSAVGGGVTQTGAVMGTPAYMAPEQAEGTHIDHRVDIYALGLILYEMFTGAPTFRAPTPIAVVMKHLQEQPTPPREFKPNLPSYVERTILRCLSKKPDERFQSVAEVVAALEGNAEEAASAEAAMPSGSPASPAAPAPYHPTVPVKPPDFPSAPGTVERAAAKPAVPQAAAAPTAAPAAKTDTVKILVFVAIFVFLFVVVAGGALFYFVPWKAKTPPTGEEIAATTPTTGEATSLQEPAGGAAPANTEPSIAEPAQTGQAKAGEGPATASASDAKSVARPGSGSGNAGAGGAAPERATPEPAPAEKGSRGAPVESPATPPLAITFGFVHAISPRGGAVNGISLSSNGQVLATAGQDHTVGIWDAGSATAVHKMRGHTGPVLGVAVSRDGSRVASVSSDGTTRFWSAGAGSEEKVLPKESAPVLRALFSPDGRILATSLGDGRIRLWETGGPDALMNLVGHSGPVFSIAFSGDGRTLVSGGRDSTVRIWNVSSGAERTVLRGHTGPVSAVAISPDGKWVASGGADNILRIWDAAAGKEVAALTGHTGSVDAVAFSPDGRWVVSGSADKSLRVWEVPSGREVTVLQRHFFGITDVAVSSSGRWLASSDSGGNVMMWRWR